TLIPAATGTSSLRVNYRRPVITILVVVALVLSVACGNIATLLLARATAKRQEWSVRVALGASRWRLVRQVMVESLMLGAAGSGLGLFIASWTSALLVRQLTTPTQSVFLNLSLDWRVLVFTLLVVLFPALLFGVTPAAHVSGIS